MTTEERKSWPARFEQEVMRGITVIWTCLVEIKPMFQELLDDLKSNRKAITSVSETTIEIRAEQRQMSGKISAVEVQITQLQLEFESGWARLSGRMDEHFAELNKKMSAPAMNVEPAHERQEASSA